MFCPKCSQLNPDNNQKCLSCGAPLSSVSNNILISPAFNSIPTPPPMLENNISIPSPVAPIPERNKATVIFVVAGVFLLLVVGIGGLFIFSKTKSANNISNAEKKNLTVVEKSESENSFNCGKDAVKDADNNFYKTVLAGNQCWMASNLNVGVKLSSGSTLPTDNGIIEKWCYDNKDANCTSNGGLYSWNEAMQYSVAEEAQGICPAGWHIPTDIEQYALENYLKDAGQICDANRRGDLAWGCSTAGIKLQSGGTSGLDFPLGGSCDMNGIFGDLFSGAYVWSSSKIETNAWFRGLYAKTASVERYAGAKVYGFSVRCLKD